MSLYELAITPSAERQWAKLDTEIQRRFKQKLIKERLTCPRVVKDALANLTDCYKIKITTPQFRLAYHVNDLKRVVTILAVSSRNDVYDALSGQDVNHL
jgi:mRNA interferase RelE/StbE